MTLKIWKQNNDELEEVAEFRKSKILSCGG